MAEPAPPPPSAAIPGASPAAAIGRPSVPDRIDRAVAAMPALPAALIRVRRVLADHTATTEDLTATVAMDAGLTVAVMRLANSARYGVSDRRFSLAQSIARIGRAELRALVDTLSVQHVFQRAPTPPSDAQAPDAQDTDATRPVDTAAIWRFSLQGALAARHWAAHLSALEVDREEAYTVALFRDLGRIHTDALVSEGDIRTQPDHRLAAEQETLGFTHADLGAELLRRWDFPERVSAAVAAHHETAQQHVDHQQVEWPPLALIAHLGDRVAVDLPAEGSDQPPDGAPRPGPSPSLQNRLAPLLPAPKETWNAVIDATREDLSAYTDLLQAA